MKLLHLTHRFEFTDRIDDLLQQHDIVRFVRYPMVQGRDRDGRHNGTKVFPGSLTVVQAHVPDDRAEALAEALRKFREQKEAHRHVEGLFLVVEGEL